MLDLDLIFTLLMLIPLGSATLILLFLRRQGTLAATLSVGSAFALAGLTVGALTHWGGSSVVINYPWLELEGFTLYLGFLLDQYSALMLLVVTIIGALIHMFSLGYMGSDDSKARYFGALSIFMFSMLGIVVSNNLIMMFIFWELVGFSSYALIAHYASKGEAAMASKKAFIVNRVGDFGFLIGIIAVYWQFGTVQFTVLEQIALAKPELVVSWMGFLLICGFIGKSAQFPLHVWLPDAMAGPTPVSALIHAATMVAAGIFMLVRVKTLLAPEVLTLILWMGAVMTAYAGFCAIAQRDIKKILAYSTLSQLGYMAFAVGLGYPGLALFHLGTHACFKALLFLGAGAVIHATHHEQDIYRMGGLMKRMPVTGLTFLIGMFALCGVTYTSGFFSKDAILEVSFFMNPKAFALVTFSAFLTAFYMGRLFVVAFLGKPRTEHAEHAKECPAVMTFPLIILAIFSLTVGFEHLWPTNWKAAFSADLHYVHQLVADSGLKIIFLAGGAVIWLCGLGLGFAFFRSRDEEDNLHQRAPRLYRFFENKLYFDEVYSWYITRIQQPFAKLLAFLDLVVISGMLVKGSGIVVSLMGVGMRFLHVGNLQMYAYWFLAGVFIFLALTLGVIL